MAVADPWGPLARQVRGADNVVPEAAAHDDLWQRVRSQLTLHTLENKRIAAERAWYQRNPDYMARVSRRATPYLYLVVDDIEARGLPLEFALLPIMESAYDPFAYSHGRAAGLWQIIPSTGRHLGLQQDWWYDGRRDVRASTRAALDYLTELGEQFDGDWLKALAAYNAGPGRIRRAEASNRRQGRPTDFWSLKLPTETRNYVPRLLALADVVFQPEMYGQRLVEIPNTPYLQVASTAGQIDLAQAARLADLDLDALYRLNPGFNRWATSPEGPHELLLPLAAADEFSAGLAELDAAERLQWTRYTVRPGDTLSVIARRFNSSADLIKQTNGINGSRIIAGKALMIPIASAASMEYTLASDQRRAAIQARGKGERLDYTVAPGDSFWSIARRFDISTRQLASWNGLAVRDPIHPGQTLVVWKAATDSVSLVDTGLALPQRDPLVRKLGYRVRRGDSLAGIAGKFNIRVEDILEWNAALRGKKYIHPGDRLTLYVDITRS